MFRKSDIDKNFRLAKFTVEKFRVLGIWFDKQLNFIHHCNHVKAWIKRRTALMKMLQFRLKFHCDTLIRIAQCYRTKICFGTWWLTIISQSQLTSLANTWGNMIKSTAGFSKFVPFKTASDFTGLDLLEDYLLYWLGSRSTEDSIFSGRLDLIGQYFETVDKLANEGKTHKYSLRKSTIEKTSNTKTKMFGKFPSETIKWFEKVKSIRERGRLLFEKHMLGFKMVLKREMLKKVIARGTWTRLAVRKINEECFEKLKLS